MELDLKYGSPEAADKILSEDKADSNRRRTRPTGPANKSRTNKTGETDQDKSLLAELKEMLNDFAVAFAERDPELADVLLRRRDAMAQGLVSVSRKIKLLRTPLLIVVSFVQPVIAFWELWALLVGRLIMRRRERASEQPAPESDTPTDIQGHGYA